MPTRYPLVAVFILSCIASASFSSTQTPSEINWRPYDVGAFTAAAKQHKLILLDLEAVWCHWCHVMDAQTYVDPTVVELIETHFIAVKADHDARPDLAERYRDWGWPATIILTADGAELIKRAGFIAPDDMVSLLTRVVNNPEPQSKQVRLPKKFSNSPQLTPGLIKELQQRHLDSYDQKLGSLAIAQKFLDRDSVEWDLYLAAKGDAAAEQRARQTLDAAGQLIDPEFGGVYQYSTRFNWKNPHYEKIMKTQSRYLIVYSKACRQLNTPQYCDAARQVANYLLSFLSDKEGSFYTSQDADLVQGIKGHEYFSLSRAQRLKKGLPRIDKHQYAGENGLAIEGLVSLYTATKEQQWLIRAIEATDWVWQNRRYADGGFRHNKIDLAGPYLGDTLFMARAFIALYRATDDEKYLNRAVSAAKFISNYFRHDQAGLVSAVDNGTPVTPLPQIDQNIQALEFFIDLYFITNNQEVLKSMRHTSRYLVTPEIALSRLTEAGLLLIDAKTKSIW